MKRYYTIFSALLIVFLFFSLGSCKKTNQDQTLSSNLLGVWTKTAYATDDNNSGVITPAEITPQPAGHVDVLVFKIDSTSYSGYECIVVDKDTQSVSEFNWYINGDSVIIQYPAHLIDTYYIDNINSGNLTLYKYGGQGLAAYYYSK